MNHSFYYKYSDYLKTKYGCKVYKLPVNLPITCPNRETGSGCMFCADVGTGFESLDPSICVAKQLLKNQEYIRKRYHADRFIAYFQNYTNTYIPLKQFKNYIEQVLDVPDIVEISISTRPDCIHSDYLEYLAQFSLKNNIHINIELGLQTVNYHTLEIINRGHSLAEYIDSVLRIQKYDMSICTHLILNLPWDTENDVIEAAKFVSVLPTDIVKLHSLYIAKNSAMAKAYMNNEFTICSYEAYLHRVKMFLEHLRPDIAVERLFSRIPEEDALFSNWGISWWKLNDLLQQMMIDTNSTQGCKFNYTNGNKIPKSWLL